MKMVFLDRDGVINENRPDHVKSWDEFVFLPGALEALRLLNQADWRVVVVTNQAAINRRLITTKTLEDIHTRMIQDIARYGGRIDGLFYCPHRPDEDCDCRKPKPGLLLKAAAHFRLRLDECYFVGDALSDMMAGYAVKTTCLLVKTGRGSSQPLGSPEVC
jgi:D-glycero-D-manno-heptose 1,7-bisphosphate phosphatase